ncbi:MAG: pyridoxal phosphate-dependent aminotransferase [Clostridia bacterium]|nr:pyridoxal phosphate-dependent aminotransferase [Clostridia bacterium]
MFDFDTVTDRRTAYSDKWDVGANELPLSTADMDFKTAPVIMEALQKRLNQGLFGYTGLPKAWNEAYCRWFSTRHGFEMQPDKLIFSTGVVPTISAAVRKLTTPNENVVLLTPVYNIFFNSIINNGRRPLEVPLAEKNGVFDIDFDALESALSDPQSSLLILCNPHNPVGKIWDRETLARIGHLCVIHHVVVLSDEIHCDITLPGKNYVPFASVNEECRMNSVICLSPTKTFSLAGLQTSAAYAENPVLRHRLWREINTGECGEPNAFAIDAVLAAYNEGAPWLDAMREYVAENMRIIRTFAAEKLPQLHVIDSEATYLLWFDCRKVTKDDEALADFIREKTGLILNAGSHYGRGGEGFLRMNTAYPRVQIEDGLCRLEKGIRLWLEEKGQ